MATTTKSKTTTKNATTSNTTKRTSSSKSKTKARNRDPRVIAVDSAYAVAGLGYDAVKVAQTLPGRVNDLRDVKARRADLEKELKARRSDIEKRVKKLRNQAEKNFDAKATTGRTVADDFAKNPQVKAILDQAKNARSQVKAAITSLRKTATTTVETGVEAGKKQAGTAKSQVKAAATSIQKTAETAVEAGRELVS